VRGDGHLIGYTDGPELIIECCACGARVEMLLFDMGGRLNCTVSCLCPCGGHYLLKGRLSRGALGDGGPRAGETI
jgi:hypothetical protein